MTNEDTAFERIEGKSVDESTQLEYQELNEMYRYRGNQEWVQNTVFIPIHFVLLLYMINLITACDAFAFFALVFVDFFVILVWVSQTCRVAYLMEMLVPRIDIIEKKYQIWNHRMLGGKKLMERRKRVHFLMLDYEKQTAKRKWSLHKPQFRLGSTGHFLEFFYALMIGPDIGLIIYGIWRFNLL